MERWVGRVALVTGASAGIGAAICRELVKQGMTVVGCARRVEMIEAIANEDAMRGKLHAIKCDMSREEEILAMHKTIKEKFGRLDVCINNAMNTKTSPLLSGDASDWRDLLEVGIVGLCINTREAVKLMKDDGQIIHMGSVVAHKIPSPWKPEGGTPTPWLHMSIGIKTMIRALAEGLRQELKAMNKSLIRVATISPGHVQTEMLARVVTKEVADAFFSTHKCLQPQDVADAVTYILKSPDYANVNDVTLETLSAMIQA